MATTRPGGPTTRVARRGDPDARRPSTRPRPSCATCARSASSATWPSAGRSSGFSTPASTTPRSRADGRQHSHHHPHRLVAQPRRGWLSRDARPSREQRRSGPRDPRAPSDERPPPSRGPQQGSPGRADARPPPRRRARLRGARPEPRRSRPEPRPRHPLRPDERRHRVRRRRRRRPRRHRRRSACRDRLGAAAPPRARATGAAGSPQRSRPTRPSGGRRISPGSRVATAHPNTTRRFFAERRIAVDVIPISGAVEVAPRLGLAEAIVDLVSTGSTLA